MQQQETLRVFLVEDSPKIVQAIRLLLSDFPELELTGTTGEAALAPAEIRRLCPDAIILDIRLKGGTGLDVLRGLRANGGPSPVVIVFSSETDPACRLACIRLGADYVLDKAMDSQRLVDILRSTVGSRHAVASVTGGQPSATL